MGAKYRHLSIEKRCEVARLRTAGYSVRQIAASLDRSPSTISRELKRNGSRTQGYQPGYAHQQAHARRWRGSKLERNDSLGEQVLARLRQNWSPEQVAGRLAPEAGRTVVSHETIYRFIYARIARKKDYSWRHYLPGAKSKRRLAGTQGWQPGVLHPASPATVRASRGCLRTGCPRPLGGGPDALRQTGADRPRPARAPLPSAHRPAAAGQGGRPGRQCHDPGAGRFPGPMAPDGGLRHGTEFARHHRLHALGVQTFFCDTHSPWQKGGVENAIGRMRRTLPRKTDPAELPDDRLDQLVRSYNNTPRKCLGCYTPAEILSDYSTNSDYFTNQVLHLKCESSFPLSRE